MVTLEDGLASIAVAGNRAEETIRVCLVVELLN